MAGAVALTVRAGQLAAHATCATLMSCLDASPGGQRPHPTFQGALTVLTSKRHLLRDRALYCFFYGTIVRLLG
jgi:hypothetical protein